MLVFFTDETHVRNGGAEDYNLCIYGGLILGEKTFANLTKELYKIKDRYLYPQELEVKWTFESVWRTMRSLGHIDASITKQTHPSAYAEFKKDHIRFKSEILDYVANSNAQLIVAIRPNKLLNASEEQNVKYSIDAVAKKFEKFLTKTDSFGIILADELLKRVSDDEKIDYQYILDLCCRGPQNVALNNLITIVPTIYSHVSAIHQINDVILGSMQFYILEFIRQLKDPSRNIDVATDIFRKITKNFHGAANGRYVINNGILMYPPKINRRNTPAGVFLNKLEKKLETDFGII